ncbi:MAG: hypothetical protein LVQ95_00780 [Candidatus Micrarchaeales archaeon]|nr:hypothetical protein [Candidatus Micrarchaeales archaeon]
MFDYEYWGTATLPISSQMALEEYLLDRSEKQRVATVRFWDVPKDAVVIGYGESDSVLKKRDATFDLARRITGGSHVQFDQNCFAYSFTVPRDGSFRHYDDMRKYYAEKVADALRELGIEISGVDNRASTISVDYKVVASHAVFWGVKSGLMHGLMSVTNYDVDRIFERMLLKERRIGSHVYSEYSALKNMPALAGFLEGRMQGIDPYRKRDYAKKLIAEEILKQVTGGKHAEMHPTQNVLDAATALVASSHMGGPWFSDRTPPYSEEEVEAIPGEALDGTLKGDLGYCMYIQVPDNDFAKMAVPGETANREKLKH